MPISQYTIKRIVSKTGTYGPYLSLEVGPNHWLMVYDQNLHAEIRTYEGAMVTLDVEDKESNGAKGPFTRHDVKAIVKSQTYNEANPPAQAPRPATPATVTTAAPAPAGSVGSPEFAAANRETRIVAATVAATAMSGGDPVLSFWRMVEDVQEYLISGKIGK